MKALVCEQFGPPESLVFCDLPDPVANDDEVVIAVRASSVNFPDTLIIQGKYQYRPDFPFSPGCEVAGDIISVGSAAGAFTPGDRVIAFPGWGGFAEQIAVPAAVVTRLPDDIDYAVGAAFLLTYATTYYAFHDRAQLQPGELVLVLGAAGGVGMAAVEIAKAMGAEVIAAASGQSKLEVCRTHGADHLLDYSNGDLRAQIKEVCQGRSIDVVYDAVGGPYSELALRSMAWNGRFLVIGFAAGDIPRIPLNLVLLKNCSLIGVFFGEFARRYPDKNQNNINTLIQWLQEKRLNPHLYAHDELKNAANAIRDLMDRKVIGKAVVVIGD